MRRYGNPQRTLTDERNRLLCELGVSTPEKFAQLTLDDLCRRYSRLRRDVITADYDAAKVLREEKSQGGGVRRHQQEGN